MKEKTTRILCGMYLASSPFIEAGCMCDWLEVFDPEWSWTIRCPGCGAECPADFVQLAIHELEGSDVFVMGCPHRSFTFSRRNQEPFFYPIETTDEARESGEFPSGS